MRVRGSVWHIRLRKSPSGFCSVSEVNNASIMLAACALSFARITSTTKLRADLDGWYDENDYYYAIQVNNQTCYVKKETALAREIETLMSDGNNHTAIVEIKGDIDIVSIRQGVGKHMPRGCHTPGIIVVQ